MLDPFEPPGVPGPEDADEDPDNLEARVALGDEMGLLPPPFTVLGEVTPEATYRLATGLRLG